MWDLRRDLLATRLGVQTSFCCKDADHLAPTNLAHTPANIRLIYAYGNGNSSNGAKDLLWDCYLKRKLLQLHTTINPTQRRLGLEKVTWFLIPESEDLNSDLRLETFV